MIVCNRCGVAPAGVTHICAPRNLVCGRCGASHCDGATHVCIVVVQPAFRLPVSYTIDFVARGVS